MFIALLGYGFIIYIILKAHRYRINELKNIIQNIKNRKIVIKIVKQIEL